jgi:hypothetical protein
MHNSSFSFRSNSTLKDQIESLRNVTKTKSDLEDRVRKLEITLVVVQKDRDYYRTIKEMYEGEMTRIGGTNPSKILM